MLRGIGRERQVALEIEGPAIRSTKFSALTRVGSPVDIVDLYRPKDPWITRFYGASFDLTLPPSQPYEGIVRDRDSGKPIEGASIVSFRFADTKIGNSTLVKTVTDREGRFRLTGMPMGAGNEVDVNPPADQPYLPAHYKLPAAGSLNPVHVDFALKRGTWVRGRVTDKVTGEPLAARLRYFATKGNPHIDEAPGYREIFYDGYSRGDYYTREDGTYELPVLPGSGVIDVEAMGPTQDYINAEEGQKRNNASLVPSFNSLSAAWAEINLGESAVTLTHDFSLYPAPYKTVTGLVLDQEGKPLTGVRYYGMYSAHWWTPAQKTNRFLITELRPPKPRTQSGPAEVGDLDDLGLFVKYEDSRPIAFFHEQKQLAGYTEVGWNTPEPIQVRLQPAANATGRIVHADGQPRANFGMQPNIILENRPRKNEAYHWQERVFTDSTGRFRVTGLVPGLHYRLFYEDASGTRGQPGLDISPLKPGESRDLGETKVDLPGGSS
jgi:hypothetical protein